MTPQLVDLDPLPKDGPLAVRLLDPSLPLGLDVPQDSLSAYGSAITCQALLVSHISLQ